MTCLAFAFNGMAVVFYFLHEKITAVTRGHGHVFLWEWLRSVVKGMVTFCIKGRANSRRRRREIPGSVAAAGSLAESVNHIKKGWGNATPVLNLRYPASLCTFRA
jgi:hypothetical protein